MAAAAAAAAAAEAAEAQLQQQKHQASLPAPGKACHCAIVHILHSPIQSYQCADQLCEWRSPAELWQL